MKTPDTFQSKEENNLIRCAVKSIADYFLNNDDNKATGLMGGEAGIILFLFYYSFCFKKSLIPYVNNRLDQLLDRIEKQEEIDLSYAEGLLGISTMMCHLAKQGFISKEKYISDDIYQVFQEYTISEIKKNNYDLLYGAGGGLLFFLNDRILLRNEHTYNILSHLMKVINKSVKDYAGMLCDSFQTGIAHGYASWLIMLPLLEKQTSTDSELLPILLEKFEKYLYVPNESDGYFPRCIYRSKDSIIWHRFGWCNGDVSCLLALLQCYEMIGEEKKKKIVIEKLKTLATRFDSIKYHVHDDAICHGSGGLFQIYKWLGNNYPCTPFSNAKNYWLQLVTSHYNKNDIFFGFRKRYFDDNNNEIISMETGLLEGLAGIGLLLISSLGFNDSWKEIFLIGLYEQGCN